MGELDVREEKRENLTILYLTGEASEKELAPMESMLMSLLDATSPEFILVDCSHLTIAGEEFVRLLQNAAAWFSEQARELVLCALPEQVLSSVSVSAPLVYCQTREEALQKFEESEKNLELGNGPSLNLIPTFSPVLKLTILAGPNKGFVRLKRGEKEVTIGRHSKCSLSLPDDIRSSRFHCKIYEKEGKFFLEDMKSSNGTIYGDTLIQKPVELKHGDRFQAGETYIEASISHQEMSGAIPVLPDLESIPEAETPFLPPLPMEYSLSPTLQDVDTIIASSPFEFPQDETLVIKKDRLSSLRAKFEFQTSKMGSPKLTVLPSFEGEEIPLSEISLPVLLKPQPFDDPGTASLKTDYSIAEKIGESDAVVLFNAIDKRSRQKVVLQCSKIHTLSRKFTLPHPYLLVPSRQEEIEGKTFRAFENPGHLAKPILPEIKVLQIGIMLTDILLSLQESGASGFDLSPCNIFYQEDELPKFAIFPATLYEKIPAEESDLFSLASLLLELSTGMAVPYTPLGTLDVEKIRPKLKLISKYLSLLILGMLNRTEKNLDKVSEKLKNILFRLLSPVTSSRESITLQVLRMGDSLVYSFGEGMSCSLPWKPGLSAQLIQDILSSPKKENLVMAGNQFYKNFWPSEIRQLLAEVDMRHIVLALDRQLLSLPWELSHDGKQFLSERFCFARKILPLESNPGIRQIIETPRIFILASGESWAKETKTKLTDELIRQFPWVKVKSAETGDSAFEILQKIAKCDILHVIGDAVYDETSPMDSGWPLTGKNVLKIRLIENCPKKPILLFSQSRLTPGNQVGDFVSLLYKAEIPNVIGTVWPVKTVRLPLDFYQYLLNGAPVDISIQEMQKSLPDDESSLSMILYGRTRLSLFSSHNTHL